MSKVSVCFTNFGPYHLARLSALADLLHESGDRLIAYEIAGREQRYPWTRESGGKSFEWITLFPGRDLEEISSLECSREMKRALDRDRPDFVGIVGYSRTESMAALNWARRIGRPTILLSESQEIDHPRTWWKEAIKRRRVSCFSAGLVGGPRHRDYLVSLGLPESRIAMGYNAVDNLAFAKRAEAARQDPESRRGLPASPYFLAVNRFVAEKNLVRLVRAFARYRAGVSPEGAWDLVLCGAGPAESEVDEAIQSSGFANSIHRPGFLQVEEQAPWLAHASAFVHPSFMEPWGLVVNEAAACGLPLLVSNRAGCVETLVPSPEGITGRRFDPFDEEEIGASLGWMAKLPERKRAEMGRRSSKVVREWGPERFASGMAEAIEKANHPMGSVNDRLNRRPKILTGTGGVRA
ncbi:glycosyltransferase family 4 protein [Tundrisphaera lichenicola]|uniref:glycosyltransferase family 4 protein n=1 Tax=Tundrisphaera lichenicola TaxID=2029860 RepID=UPI003EB92A0B